MVFTVRDGLLISSIMYRIRKDGRAIIIKIMAGSDCFYFLRVYGTGMG